MVKHILIFSGVAILSLLIALSVFFETQSKKLQRQTQTYKNDAVRLEKIISLNLWLSDVRTEAIQIIQENEEMADARLIAFFDAHKNLGNFAMQNYIVADPKHPHIKSISFAFHLPQDDKKRIEKFFLSSFEHGYKRLDSLRASKEGITGKITLFSPFRKDTNGTNK